MQGGVDYFRIVEGTTLNCFVSFFFLSLFIYPLQLDSEHYFRKHNSTPLLVFLSPSLYTWTNISIFNWHFNTLLSSKLKVVMLNTFCSNNVKKQETCKYSNTKVSDFLSLSTKARDFLTNTITQKNVWGLTLDIQSVVFTIQIR